MLTFISYHYSMATNDNVSTDVTMESLANGMQTLSTGMQSIRAELTALQNREGIQNLSLDERGRERPYRPFQGAPGPHNTKVQYFSNLPGENFLAWRSQFQVIANYHRWSDKEAKQLMYVYMKGTALDSVMDIPQGLVVLEGCLSNIPSNITSASGVVIAL